LFLSDAFARLSGLAPIAELGQFSVQIPLQFIVERYAKWPASCTFYPSES
jgi:hypothetical protein